MKTFDVEIIINRNEVGHGRLFKSYALAKRYAIKESLNKGVLETFIFGSDDNDPYFEVMEYYSNGLLSIKIA